MSFHEPQDLGLEPAAWCKRCQGTMHTRIEVLESGIHWAKRMCANCGAYICFEAKPDGERKNRPSGARKVAKRYSAGFCEMCLRRDSELPPGQVLEGHHKIPHKAEEAKLFGFDEPGDDSRENIWILCTACHHLVDWARTYVTAHYRKMLGESSAADLGDGSD